MNKLLQHQIEKFFGDANSAPKSLESFLKAISDAYDSFDTDRKLIERALDMSSEELTEINRKLRQEVNDRGQTQEKVEHMLSLLTATLESTADGILVVDIKGKVVSCNHKFQQLWRIPDELIENKNDDKLLAYVLDQLEDPEGFLAGVRRLYTSTEEESFDLLKFKDGRVFERFSQPQKVGDRILGRVWSFRNVTERKRAEEHLLAANELQKLLLPPVPIEQKLKVITDAVVRILNADFARIWVIKPGDRCDAGCTHAEVTDGPHVCRFRDKCLHLMASSGRYTHLDGKVHRRVPFGCYKIGLVAAGEHDKFLTNEAATDPRVHNHDWVKELGLVSFAGYRLMHTDGTRLGVLALFSKHPISPEEDALLEGIAHSTSMVIHTSKTEEELRKNEEFTRRVIESSSDCIKVLDLQGHLLSMSGGGQKLLEIDDITPYLNASFIDYWKGKEREDCIEAIEKAKKGDTGLFYGYFETAKGAPKWWEVIITPIKDSNGTINRLLAVSRDISERRQADETVKNLNKDLKSTVALLTRSNRQLREFAYSAAHDLKTPLRGISTLAQWLVNDYQEKFDEEGKQKVDLLIKRTDRMNKLVNAILHYSTLIRERDKEYPIDLNTLVGRVLVEIKPPTNIQITINKNLPVVICKGTHLHQIYYQLLTNAVKFMDKPKGRIAIDCIDKGDFWEFSVSDNGLGIEPQHFERIFRLFQTLDDHSRSEGGGVGLTIVRKIVELYDGQIWLASELGQGSTFFFTLPKQKIAVEDAKFEASTAG